MTLLAFGLAAPVLGAADVCAGASTNSLRVHLPRSGGGALAEVQLCAVRQHPPSSKSPCLSERAYLVRGSDAADGAERTALIPDLIPDTEYALRFREEGADGEWRATEVLGACRTAVPLTDQPNRVVRRVGSSLEVFALEVEWAPPQRAGGEIVGYELQHSLVRSELQHSLVSGEAGEAGEADGAPPALLKLAATARSARVDGLAAGRTYSLRVRALLLRNATRGAGPREALASGLGFGPWSDAAALRTRQPLLAPLPLVRFSERCAPGGACEPDYLRNHDAADVLADAALLTRFVARQRACGRDALGLQWPQTAVVRYCVTRAAAAVWAAYLPCNGLSAGNYSCACAGRYDRMLARQPLDGCDADPPQGELPPLQRLPRPSGGLLAGLLGSRGGGGSGGAHAPAPPGCAHSGHGRCACDLEREGRRLGRMPSYLPFPGPGPSAPPPANESAFLGSWYSLPASARCAAGQLPSVGGCAWQLDAQQPAAIVRGTELLAAGWREVEVLPDGTVPSPPLALVLHNAGVLQGLLDARTPRCCGC